LWDLEVGKRSLEFEAHSGDVVSISLSPDSKSYITGSVDKTCRLWDLRDEKPKQTFFGHTSDVNSVCVSCVSFASITASSCADIRTEQSHVGFFPCFSPLLILGKALFF
jgi:guanine nucleotide-binding protein subunit beta